MTAHDGVQVSFIESFAQPPSADAETSPSAPPCKLAQLRPSLVIAGDAKALEVVRTVHSPKSALQSPMSRSQKTVGGSGALVSPKRRLSFSDALGNAVLQAKAAVDSETCSKWRLVWREKFSGTAWQGKMDFAATIAALVFTIHSYGKFLRWHEDRTDIEHFATLSDPILPYMDAHDLSAPLFFLVYGAIIGGIVYGFDKPDLLIEFSQTNTLVMWVRMIALYLTPLEAPQGMIPLVDPIAHADGNILVRDLFFSGHTATTYLVFLVCRCVHWRWKLLFLVVALTTGSMVVVQKTHYTIDVFAAPFFVYTSHGIVQEIRRACNGFYELPGSIAGDHQASASSKVKAN